MPLEQRRDFRFTAAEAGQLRHQRSPPSRSGYCSDWALCMKSFFGYVCAMTRKTLFALTILFFCSAATYAAPQTMRLDYFHTGDAKQELFSVDRVVIEPLPWPGDLSKNIDDTNLGKYFFEVRDQKTKRVLFSRGFASIYGEWETTDEAKSMVRTFGESLRFPAPDATVELILQKRDSKNAWQDLWSTVIDPKDIFIDRSKPRAPASLIPIQKMGDPSTKVDFLILGDGYTARERAKFVADARRLTEVLFATSPFKEHRRDFNVWALCPPAAQSGISRPSTGVYRDSFSTYDAFGSERYVLAFDNRALRKVAQFAPYEFIEILANNRTYGGGGIFNLYSTVAADNGFANYVFVHEFGHHFAGLADEYYTSAVAYAPATERIEPWEPNATALLDPASLKWKDLMIPDTPIPTPWNKEEFEAYSREIQKRRAEIRKQRLPESVMEALFREELKHEQAMFAKEKYLGRVGAFEGAIYEAKGYYRPEIDCIMFTRTNHFCAVCRRAIERIISLYSR
jgi:IgA Peptidase M64/Peptidase M64 N-terminus